MLSSTAVAACVRYRTWQPPRPPTSQIGHRVTPVTRETPRRRSGPKARFLESRSVTSQTRGVSVTGQEPTIGNRRTRGVASPRTTMAPVSRSLTTVGGFAPMSSACSAALLPVARRTSRNDGALAPLRASSVPKSVSSLMRTRCSVRADSITTSSEELASPMSARAPQRDPLRAEGRRAAERGSRRAKTSCRMAQRQLAFTHRRCRIPQRFGDILGREVGELSYDLICRHAVRDHRHDSGHGYPKPSVAGRATHHVLVDGDPLERHICGLPAGRKVH